MSLVSCIVMMPGRVVYASCLSSSCLFVMLLMFNCSTDMPVACGFCGGFWMLRVFCYLLVWVLSVVLVLRCGSEHVH